MILLSLVLIVASCLIIWRSSHGFELASDYLGRKLPLGIKGATLNAIASSMPEFLTTMFFLFYLNDPEGFSGGLAVTSGSALFNLLLIPSLAVMALFMVRKGEKIVLKKRILAREGLVLILSQLLFVSFLYYQGSKGPEAPDSLESLAELTVGEGSIMVLIYVLYLFLLYLIAKKKSVPDPGFETPELRNNFSLFIRILLLDLTNAVLNGRELSRGRAWLLLLVSTVCMTAGTWLLVLGTDMFGERTGIPLVFIAVVLSAMATSIPDTIISIKDARKGNYDDAVSNALGSNIFDIAFALGLPILLYDLFYEDPVRLGGQILEFTQELWVFLIMATIAALLIMMIGKYFNRLKASMLLVIYALFLAFVGSQVHQDFFLSEPVREFMTNLADIIGSMFH